MIAQLQEQAENSVVGAAGLGRGPRGDFALQSGHQALRRGFGLGQFHQDGGANGIGQIGDEFPTGPGAVGFQVGEGVVVEQLQMAGGGEFVLEEIEKALVFFDGQHFAALLQKGFGQGTEAGADFQDLVARRNLRCGDDAADLVLVVQKILAERF